jgi:tRNA pseudouridine38-40 synthase
MRRIRLTVAYDGTDFAGWQRQANAPTIQETIERALLEMTGRPTDLRGAGRTDAGVHAAGQVAHFDSDGRIPSEGFRKGLNALLPRSIAVLAADEVPPTFDARFSAMGKLYRYRIWNRETRDPLNDRYVWHHPRRLDVARMLAAAARLVGRHDFAAFRAADCERRTTVRTLSRLDVREDHGLVSIEVEADAFLKNMVRILAGTLAHVGWGKLSPDEVAALFDRPDRRLAGQTAPARGLLMVKVDYGADGLGRPRVVE